MAFEFVSRCMFNAVFVLQSLRDEDHKVARDLEDGIIGPYCRNLGLFSSFEQIGSTSDLERALEVILKESSLQTPAYPIIHLDAHGSPNGIELSPSGESVAWRWLHDQFRAINIATANNMLVVLTSCDGVNALRETIPLSAPAPFWGFVAARGHPTGGELHERFSPFYRILLTTSNFPAAERTLGQGYESFSVEQLLVYSVLAYFMEHAIGSGRAKYSEDLTTKLLSKYRAQGSEPMLRDVRRFVKAAIAPEKFDLEKYKRLFLMADDPRNSGRYTWSLDDIIKEARGKAN